MKRAMANVWMRSHASLLRMVTLNQRGKIISIEGLKSENSCWISCDHITGWWFHIFFNFTPIWGNDPI